MYETMVFWETAPTDDEPAVFRDYAGIWRAAEKFVYSRTVPNGIRAQLELLDERRYKTGSVHLHYCVIV